MRFRRIWLSYFSLFFLWLCFLKRFIDRILIVKCLKWMERKKTDTSVACVVFLCWYVLSTSITRRIIKKLVRSCNDIAFDVYEKLAFDRISFPHISSTQPSRNAGESLASNTAKEWTNRTTNILTWLNENSFFFIFVLNSRRLFASRRIHTALAGLQNSEDEEHTAWENSKIGHHFTRNDRLNDVMNRCNIIEDDI